MIIENEYKLYVGKLQELPEGVKYSYYNSSHEYILIYTDLKLDATKFYTVDDSLLCKLNSQERSWLQQAVVTVNAAYIRQNRNKVIDLLERLLDKYEEELKKEQANATRTE